MMSKEPDDRQETFDFEVLNLIELLESYDNILPAR